jgi:E3 ubiquitin-protein ligase synoviolin
MRYQQPNAPRPSISQLPPTLTEAQLALMDRVTRDAIDERLRVLEGVSGAVFRCIEDLMRVRSSLPTPTTPTPGTISSAANPPAFASSSSNAAAVNQPSIVSASETLDEAIAGAREVAESSSKMEDSIATDLAQPSVAGSSNLQQEHQRPSPPSHPEAEPAA